MSSHREKSNETMTPVPDVTTVSDGKDEEVIDLEAVTRAVRAKLKEDLAKAKTRNEEIAWKKKERADRLRKNKEDEDVAEVKKADEETARKKVPVQPLVSSVCLSSWGQKLTWFPDWASSSARERDSGAIQTQGEWWEGFLVVEG